MKFSAAQLEFLMTKLSTADIEEIQLEFLMSTADIEEALVFKPAKKVVALEDKCFKIKKDGSQCSRAAKVNGLCSAHDTTRVKVVVSDEVRCKGLKKTGEQCGMKKKRNGDYCGRHALKKEKETTLCFFCGEAEREIYEHDKDYGKCDDCGMDMKLDSLILCSCCGEKELYGSDLWCDECERWFCRNCECAHYDYNGYKHDNHTCK